MMVTKDFVEALIRGRESGLLSPDEAKKFLLNALNREGEVVSDGN